MPHFAIRSLIIEQEVKERLLWWNLTALSRVAGSHRISFMLF
jgi:hypothetical protein